MGDSPVFVFSSGTTWKALDDLEASQGFECQYFTSALALSNRLKNHERALVFLLLREKSDYAQIETFLSFVKTLSQSMVLKLVAVPFLVDKQIFRLQVKETLAPDVDSSTLLKKLELWKTSINSKESDKKGAQITYLDPIKCTHDIWMNLENLRPKKVMDKWLVCLGGLSPNSGKWVETATPHLWRFELSPSIQQEIPVSDGEWLFCGDTPPDYFWQDKHWLLFGPEFDLYFSSNEGTFSRVSANQTSLKIAGNSPQAEVRISGLSQKSSESDKVVILRSKSEEELYFEQFSQELERGIIDVEKLCSDASVEITVLQDGRSVNVRFDDRIDGTIILATEKPSIETDRNISLDISFTMLGKTVKVHVEGSAVKMSEENGTFFYELSLDEEKKIDLIIKLIELRQKMVTKFHEIASGY